MSGCCRGKRQYRSRDEAVRALEDCRVHDRRERSLYRCGHGWWHLTSRTSPPKDLKVHPDDQGWWTLPGEEEHG